MSNTNTGGPAFPTTKPLDSWDDPNQGMTLRDYFAAKAMQGVLAGYVTGLPPSEMTAEAAYKYADAMLKAREA